MKIFALLTVLAIIGGSHAFIGEVADMFKNLGHELGAVGKDLLHVAQPVAISLLQTLEKAGTQLLTTAASDLLSHIGTAAGKRDLGEVMDKIGKFVTNTEKYLKGTGTALTGAYKFTLEKIEEEIQHVINDAKPVSGLIEEVEHLITGHNDFIDHIAQEAKSKAMEFISGLIHPHENKRDILSTALNFGQGIEHLIQEVSAPLKSALSGLVTSLESKVLGLLG